MFDKIMPGLFTLLGVLIGSSISIFLTALQLFHQNKKDRLERIREVFGEAIDAASQILQVAEQEDVIDGEEHKEIRKLSRQARFKHFAAVSKLRLEGYPELADGFIQWSDFVNGMDRKKRLSEEGWKDITERGNILIKSAEDEIKKIASGSFSSLGKELVRQERHLLAIGRQFLDVACRILILFFASAIYISGHPQNTAYGFIEKWTAPQTVSVKQAIVGLRANQKISKDTPGFYPLIDLARSRWSYIEPSQVVSIELVPGFGSNSVDIHRNVVQPLRFIFSNGQPTENVNLTDIEKENEENLSQALSKRIEQLWFGQFLFSVLLIILIISPRNKR